MSQTKSSEIFNYVIVNGECIAREQATISLFNEALFSSFGVYETVKIDRGRPFYLEEHLRRLLRSAQMIDLDLKVDVETLGAWFERLHALDPEATWSLRMLGLGDLDQEAKPIAALQALPLPTYPDSFYREGARAVLYEGERAIPLCKSLNTLVNYLARRTARQAGALEGLLHHNGYLTEGARSSLFAVRDGEILACPQERVLPGITRDILIHVMQETDHPIVEEELPVGLSLYEEIFITATSMHVMPITQVDEQPIGDGRVGPLTKLAMTKFNEYYKWVMAKAKDDP